MDEEFQDCSLNNEFGRKLETPHGERASPVPGVNKYEVAGGMAHGHWVSARGVYLVRQAGKTTVLLGLPRSWQRWAISLPPWGQCQSYRRSSFPFHFTAYSCDTDSLCLKTAAWLFSLGKHFKQKAFKQQASNGRRWWRVRFHSSPSIWAG